VTASIIDGRAIASQIRSEVAQRVMALVDDGVQPGLAAVLVGEDEASHIYVATKQKACADVGIRSE
jgi:methylenetetrahydrofolate dehydrogenase (NADP+)/methenyltetrahydrofolate cyclohydrolase